MKKSTTTTLLLIAALTLGGCSGYGRPKADACQGYEDHRGCKNIQQVYGEIHRETYSDDVQAGLITPGTPDGMAPANQLQLIGYAPMVDEEAVEKPIRTQAVVVRIWIAPWQDESDQLHAPGHVYAEAVAPKWLYGQEKIRKSRSYLPTRIKP